MPNILPDGKKPLDDKAELCSNAKFAPKGTAIASPNDWEQYKTPISQIEKMSGFKILNIK
jgi:hypothetical protein